jgi:hypothetical protein
MLPVLRIADAEEVSNKLTYALCLLRCIEPLMAFDA